MFKKTKILSIILLFLISIQSAYAVFSDIAPSHPNYEAILYLEENGVIEGYEDGTFRPDQLVNRAEALKIILLGSDIFVPEFQEQEIFPDVIYGSWYAKYVMKAKNMGIVSGDDDTGMFRPGDTVNLAEAMKILLNTNQIETESPDSDPHPDVPSDAWFAPYFGYAQSISLLDQTSSENVHPATAVNRGMLAELMYRLTLKPKGYQEGEASFYGMLFHGKTTASGETFDASGFTAAHRTLPFNTWVRVTNKENGKMVDVRVNDRGPYAGDNRIIDLSKAAFETISSLSRGVIDVSILPISGPSAGSEGTSLYSASLLDVAQCAEKNNLEFLSKDSFDNITLTNEIPNRLAEGEVLALSGTTSSSNKTVSTFIVDSDDNQYSFYAPSENGSFEFNVFFSGTGTYKLGILPGSSGTSIVREIKVLPKVCVSENEDTSLPSPSSLSVNAEDGNTVLNWDKSGYGLFKIKFTQGSDSATYFIHDADRFIPYYPDLVDFEEGDVQVSVQGAFLSVDSLLESQSVTWSSPATKTFNAVTHYEYIIDSENVELTSFPDYITQNNTFNIKLRSDVSLLDKSAIILSDGEVEEVGLISTRQPITNVNGVKIFPPSDEELTLTYKPLLDGIYFAEINDSDALAAVNIPLYPQNQYPLIPNPVELFSGIEDLGDDLGALRNQMLVLVNSDRADHGRSPVVLDPSLNNLAQYRSDDMAENNYFSHWDDEGRDANDIKKNFAISQSVAENVAKDVSLELAEYGLMRSALHRSNILNDEWTRAGFGVSKNNDGSYTFVQIFSADPLDTSNINSLRQTILEAVNNNRTVALSLQTNLNDLAQSWSEKMVGDNFFDFTAPDSSDLVTNIRDSGITASLGTYIIGNTSFQDAVDQIAGNSQIAESHWKYLGIGIEQDSLGIIKITLIYTE